MKITDKTTLSELMTERARLGITQLTLRVHTNNRVCIVLTEHGGTQCSGTTEAEAIAKAFAVIERDGFEDKSGDLSMLPVPPGAYNVIMTGDPLAEHTATITDGEHAGKTFAIPAPKLDGDLPYHMQPATSEKPPIIPRKFAGEVSGRPLPSEPERCNVPMCGDSGLCAACRARGAK